MRKTMQHCVRKYIENNKNTSLILIDIGVWPFHDLLEKYPNRAKNIGIFEPGTISTAAGLSLKGIEPVIYGISPFLVERSLEQIKLDFIYQGIGGNLITTGASYDFSTLGYSHYCPEDISILHQFPTIDILTPATPKHFEQLWKHCCSNGKLSYFRMTDYSCTSNVSVVYGKNNIIKTGKKCLVICAGEILDETVKACDGLDVTILFVSTVQPFDKKSLIENFNEKIFICEPFYKGTLAQIIVENLDGARASIYSLGISREVIRNYGTKKEKDDYYGLTSNNIRNKIIEYLY